MIQKFEIHNINELEIIAKTLVSLLKEASVFAFYGHMGAGKTTLIQKVCQELGITDDVNSPSFSIVNEYIGSSERIVYHFDFYRITRIEEAFDIGYENYFYSGYPCFVEWPEKIEQLLPEKYVKVTISAPDITERRWIDIEIVH
jgi:tRNA threonylcarbamoyladenosine biosynthesis protein TsaE